MSKIMFFIFIILNLNSFCQNRKIDSVKDFLKIDNKLRDSVKTTHNSDSTFQERDPEDGGITLKFTSKKEFWFGISLLIAMILILPLFIYVIRKKNMSDELSVKLLLTTIVIISTLFLVVAGYDDKAIAPAFGLFGAILGYIFGKSESKNS